MWDGASILSARVELNVWCSWGVGGCLGGGRQRPVNVTCLGEDALLHDPRSDTRLPALRSGSDVILSKVNLRL